MPDILIRGMELPENEPLRIFLDANGQVFVDRGVYYDEFEAIELPEHGDLLAAVPRWISVEERLPTAEDGDPWDRCLAYSDEDQLMTLPLCKVGNGYVTHWMRIEPPKEDAE